MFSYQQYQFLNEALESGKLDSTMDINSAVEELMKYVNLSKDKGDTQAIVRAILQFKQDRIFKLTKRSLEGGRELSASHLEKLSAILSNLIFTEGFSISVLSAFFRKIEKRSFIEEMKITPGIKHDFHKVIPEDPVLSKIWKQLYATQITIGATSMGRGELLLNVLGAGKPNKKDEDGGGDVALPNGSGIEMKMRSATLNPRSSEINYRFYEYLVSHPEAIIK